MSSNQVCVIEGDYNVTYDAASPSKQSEDKRLSQLIESYKKKLNLATDASSESSSSSKTASEYSKFTLIHSKDGSELYTSILQSFGLTASDLDNTINSANGDTTVSTIVTANGTNKAQQQRTTNSNYTTFICFLINDFDQNDNVFTKLEETQLKLCNFLNTLNHATAHTSQNGNIQKRFMIFGWPVLHYCLENSLVPPYSFKLLIKIIYNF